MIPSKEECENALAQIPETDVIAISILAAGYLELGTAADYIHALSNLNGVAVGVSKERHAQETFSVLEKKLNESKSD
jgi:hypothetical protein